MSSIFSRRSLFAWLIVGIAAVSFGQAALQTVLSHPTRKVYTDEAPAWAFKAAMKWLP